MSEPGYGELAAMYKTAKKEIARLNSRLDAVRTIVGENGGKLTVEIIFYDEQGDMWTEEELNELIRETTTEAGSDAG